MNQHGHTPLPAGLLTSLQRVRLTAALGDGACEKCVASTAASRTVSRGKSGHAGTQVLIPIRLITNTQERAQAHPKVIPMTPSRHPNQASARHPQACGHACRAAIGPHTQGHCRTDVGAGRYTSGCVLRLPCVACGGNVRRPIPASVLRITTCEPGHPATCIHQSLPSRSRSVSSSLSLLIRAARATPDTTSLPCVPRCLVSHGNS